MDNMQDLLSLLLNDNVLNNEPNSQRAIIKNEPIDNGDIERLRTKIIKAASERREQTKKLVGENKREVLDDTVTIGIVLQQLVDSKGWQHIKARFFEPLSSIVGLFDLEDDKLATFKAQASLIYRINDYINTKIKLMQELSNG